MIDNNFRFSSNALYSLSSVETSANLRYTAWRRGTIHDNTKHEVIDHTKWSPHATFVFNLHKLCLQKLPSNARFTWQMKTTSSQKASTISHEAGMQNDTFFLLRKAMPGSKWSRTNMKTMLVHQSCSENKIYFVIAFDHNYCIWIKQILPICTLTYLQSDYFNFLEVSNILVPWIWILLSKHIIMKNKHIGIPSVLLKAFYLVCAFRHNLVRTN